MMLEEKNEIPRIAVIIPCFRVKRSIMNVLSRIGPEVENIYVVDDVCPEESRKYVEENCRDPRVVVLCRFPFRGHFSHLHLMIILFFFIESNFFYNFSVASARRVGRNIPVSLPDLE